MTFIPKGMTMTVAELRDALRDFADTAPVRFESNGNIHCIRRVLGFHVNRGDGAWLEVTLTGIHPTVVEREAHKRRAKRKGIS